MFRENGQKQEIRHIIWDWNGTLLNDVVICINCINSLLDGRELPCLDLEKYRRIFTFPVRDYYIEAGFDFNAEPFDLLAVEFIDNYKKLIGEAKLFTDVINTLETFKSAGVNQYIVSAMEQEFLKDLVAGFGLTNYFIKTQGINDHYAESKSHIAGHLLQELNMNKSETWFIGDTLHDFEVATENGMQSILIDRGHQSYDRLITSGQPVVSDLREVAAFFNLDKIKKD